MASAIAHEMNNYLAIISNNSELLTYNVNRDNITNAKRNAEQISETIMRVKKFTNGLMDLSKMETEFVTYDITQFLSLMLPASVFIVWFYKTN